jgi:hypothetical protein
MTTRTAADPLGAAVRTCQIIVAAMIMGIIPLLAVSLAIGPLSKSQPGAAGAGAGAAAPDNPLGQILTYTAIGFGGLALVMAIIVPRLVAANARKALVQKRQTTQPGNKSGKAPALQSIDNQQRDVVPIFQSQLIVGVALLEGAAFFAGMVHLLGGDPVVLAVVAILMCGMIAFFPTRAKAVRWIEQQQERLRDDESSARPSP